MKEKRTLHQCRWRVSSQIARELDHIRKNHSYGTWDEFFQEIITQSISAQENIPPLSKTLNSLRGQIAQVQFEFQSLKDTVEKLANEQSGLTSSIQENTSELSTIKDLITVEFKSNVIAIQEDKEPLTALQKYLREKGR